MRSKTLDAVIHALVLVRLGQELGCGSPVARAVHDVVEAVVAFLGAVR